MIPSGVFVLVLCAAARAQQVCDPANPNADPQCGDNGGGPPEEHCDTCSYADTCGVADTCGYADQCGVADTCLTADSCGVCDVADYAAACGTCDVCDVALSVGECVSGVWGVDGAAGSDCGDLQYNGSVGINTAPQATLDVLGTVALRGATLVTGDEGLHVSADGSVGIGTQAPTAALQVAGRVVADSVHVGPQVLTVSLIGVSCRDEDASANGTGFTGFSNRLYCPLPVPSGGRIESVRCSGNSVGLLDAEVYVKDASFTVVATHASFDHDLDAMPELAVPTLPTLDTGGSALLMLDAGGTIAYVYGCQVTYEVTQWL